MPRSLYYHIATVFSVVFAVVMILSVQHLSDKSRAQLLTGVTQGLVEQAHLVTELLPDVVSRPVAGEIPTAVELEALADLVHHAAQITGKHIRFLDGAGTVLADSLVDGPIYINAANQPEIQTALEGQIGQDVRADITTRTEMLYIATPLSTSVPYIIHMATPLTAYAMFVEDEYRQLLWIAMLLIGVSALMAFVVAKRAGEPVRQMTHLAEQMTDGDFSGRVPITSDSELGQLGIAYNRLAVNLSRQFDHLSQRREELEYILDTMTDGVLAVDNRANLLLLNPAAMELFGITDPVAERRPIVETIRQPQLVTAMHQVVTEKKRLEFELVLHRPTERILDVTVSSVNAVDTANGLVGAMAVLRDVTALRRLERVRQDFVANVSHELRTPLTAIKGFIETLKETEDPAERQSYLDIVEEETESLVLMVEDLLRLARLESSEVGSEIEAANPAHLVAHAVHLLQPRITAKQLDVRVVANNVPLVWADTAMIDQALINLLDNAIKYTPAGGQIILSFADLLNGFVRFIIKDNGPGMERKHTERIFERFYRVDKARSRHMGGTGLGLSIVKHTIEQHDGRVGVQSQPGHGSTFWFDLRSVAPTDDKQSQEPL